MSMQRNGHSFTVVLGEPDCYWFNLYGDKMSVASSTSKGVDFSNSRVRSALQGPVFRGWGSRAFVSWFYQYFSSWTHYFQVFFSKLQKNRGYFIEIRTILLCFLPTLHPWWMQKFRCYGAYLSWNCRQRYLYRKRSSGLLPAVLEKRINSCGGVIC
jgi:hypothetical protein